MSNENDTDIKVERIKMSYRYDAKSHQVHMWGLKTPPARRGVGKTHGMLKWMLKHVKERHPGSDIYLTASLWDDSPVTLEEMIDFYKSFGFEETGRYENEVTFVYEEKE